MSSCSLCVPFISTRLFYRQNVSTLYFPRQCNVLPKWKITQDICDYSKPLNCLFLLHLHWRDWFNFIFRATTCLRFLRSRLVYVCSGLGKPFSLSALEWIHNVAQKHDRLGFCEKKKLFFLFLLLPALLVQDLCSSLHFSDLCIVVSLRCNEKKINTKALKAHKNCSPIETGISKQCFGLVESVL